MSEILQEIAKIGEIERIGLYEVKGIWFLEVHFKQIEETKYYKFPNKETAMRLYKEVINQNE
jgi:hypothetical protein